MGSNFYFSNFSNVTINGNSYKNIFERIRIKEAFRSSRNIFNVISVIDGVTPEDVAFKVYSDKKLFWVVLVANSVQDYFYDWPITDKELRSLATKYAENGDYPTGVNENEIYAELFEENDAKRKNINVLKPEFLLDFLTIAKKMHGGAV